MLFDIVAYSLLKWYTGNCRWPRNYRNDGPLQHNCKFGIMTPIENSSSPYKDVVPPTDGSSSLIVKIVLVKPPPFVRRMMLFQNDDVAHSPQCHTCYSGAFLAVDMIVEFT